MKKLALITAIAASLAAPAFADATAVIQHFNQDADSFMDVRSIPSSDGSVTVSTNNRSAQAAAFAVFNASASSQGDLRGLNGATLVQSHQSDAAAAIFADLRAAGLENE